MKNSPCKSCDKNCANLCAKWQNWFTGEWNETVKTIKGEVVGLKYIKTSKGWDFYKNKRGMKVYKSTGEAELIISSSPESSDFLFSVHNNIYFNSENKISLESKDIKSACDEAGDIYRGLLTEAVDYLTEQVNLLPEI